MSGQNKIFLMGWSVRTITSVNGTTSVFWYLISDLFKDLLVKYVGLFPSSVSRQLTKISYANCLDEKTILVDMILYLSLYYIVNDLVHLPNPYITLFK